MVALNDGRASGGVKIKRDLPKARQIYVAVCVTPANGVIMAVALLNVACPSDTWVKYYYRMRWMGRIKVTMATFLLK
jgi:hypothetical protein